MIENEEAYRMLACAMSGAIYKQSGHTLYIPIPKNKKEIYAFNIDVTFSGHQHTKQDLIDVQNFIYEKLGREISTSELINIAYPKKKIPEPKDPGAFKTFDGYNSQYHSILLYYIIQEENKEHRTLKQISLHTLHPVLKEMLGLSNLFLFSTKTENPKERFPHAINILEEMFGEYDFSWATK